MSPIPNPGGQKNIHNLADLIFAEEVGAHAQNIAVIVLAGPSRAAHVIVQPARARTERLSLCLAATDIPMPLPSRKNSHPRPFPILTAWAAAGSAKSG